MMRYLYGWKGWSTASAGTQLQEIYVNVRIGQQSGFSVSWVTCRDEKPVSLILDA